MADRDLVAGYPAMLHDEFIYVVQDMSLGMEIQAVPSRLHVLLEVLESEIANAAEYVVGLLLRNRYSILLLGAAEVVWH